jgi:hypothetical protein
MKKDSIQVAANVAKVGLVILWITFMIALSSCKAHETSNRCSKHKSRSRTFLAQVPIKDSLSDYFFINNQIVIIERQR